MNEPVYAYVEIEVKSCWSEDIKMNVKIKVTSASTTKLISAIN